MNRLNTPPDADPWDRLPGESERHYARFALYRDMGRVRTIKQCAALVGIQPQSMRKIAARWRWVERAHAWDAEQDRAFVAQVAKARQQLVLDQARVANAALEHAAERLRRITRADMDSMDLLQLVRAADLAFRWLHAAYSPAMIAQLEPKETAETVGSGELTELDDLLVVHAENARLIAALNEWDSES